MEKYNYLIYVRKYNFFADDYVLYVYQTYTEDIYHTIGEIVARSIEQIKVINCVDWSEERVKACLNGAYEIYTWYDKYKKVVE